KRELGTRPEFRENGTTPNGLHELGRDDLVELLAVLFVGTFAEPNRILWIGRERKPVQRSVKLEQVDRIVLRRWSLKRVPGLIAENARRVRKPVSVARRPLAFRIRSQRVVHQAVVVEGNDGVSRCQRRDESGMVRARLFSCQRVL